MCLLGGRPPHQGHSDKFIHCERNNLAKAGCILISDFWVIQRAMVALTGNIVFFSVIQRTNLAMKPDQSCPGDGGT